MMHAVFRDNKFFFDKYTRRETIRLTFEQLISLLNDYGQKQEGNKLDKKEISTKILNLIQHKDSRGFSPMSFLISNMSADESPAEMKLNMNWVDEWLHLILE